MMNLKRRISKWRVIAFCLLVGLAVAHAGQKPNVVLFYADDLGWGDLRHHNTAPEHFRYTPNMDRLFTDGVELGNYMTHSVCSPSRAGLLTGRHYANVGAGPRTGGTLPNNIPNIAKDFKAAGYRTGAFGKWHNSHPNFPEDGNGKRVDYNKAATFNELFGERTLDLTNNIFENHKGWKWGEGVNAYGFDRWVGYYNGGGDFFNRYVDWHHDVDWWHDRKYRGDEKGYTTDLITKYAIEFIESSKKNPFFCYIPQEAVHDPLQLKRSDLIEFCAKLDSELGIKGQWKFVSNIVSPDTGRKIGDVAEIRCEQDEEFDVYRIDPDQKHYAHLVYSAFLYSLDKSIGAVVEKVTALGLLNDTIFFFASDNGATSKGVNAPFRGGKHSLWEGGVHVPAAFWWPGRFEKSAYDGFISYLDIYPTLMGMAGLMCTARELDGKDCWKALQANAECRPDPINDAIFWMWYDHGTVRTRKWKLYYSEDARQVKLYDMERDVEETTDLAASNPEIREKLIRRYRDWINENNYAMSFMPIDKTNISHPDPNPEGDVLEIKAEQVAGMKKPYSDGLFIRFSDGEGWREEYDAYIHAGDRIEFDIYVCEDSDITSGCTYMPGNGWLPFYKQGVGLNQDGVEVVNAELPKGKWTRQVIGIGNYCPGPIPVNYIALQSGKPGTYHVYMDNIVIRKKDGGIRSVIWQSKEDFAPILYRYKGINHQKLEKAKAVKGFPFSDISIGVLGR